MKTELKSMLTALTLALASPVLMADDDSDGNNPSAPQTGGYYGWGPGMMHHPGYGMGMGRGMMYAPGYDQRQGYGPGYGMGPGMMHRPGYRPRYGMGPGMMYGPGYGGSQDSDNDDSPTFRGPGIRHRPGYGGRR